MFQFLLIILLVFAWTAVVGAIAVCYVQAKVTKEYGEKYQKFFQRNPSIVRHSLSPITQALRATEMMPTIHHKNSSTSATGGRGNNSDLFVEDEERGFTRDEEEEDRYYNETPPEQQCHPAEYITARSTAPVPSQKTMMPQPRPPPQMIKKQQQQPLQQQRPRPPPPPQKRPAAQPSFSLPQSYDYMGNASTAVYL